MPITDETLQQLIDRLTPGTEMRLLALYLRDARAELTAAQLLATDREATNTRLIADVRRIAKERDDANTDRATLRHVIELYKADDKMLRDNNAALDDALQMQIKRCETLTNDRALAQQEIDKHEKTIARLIAQRDSAENSATNLRRVRDELQVAFDTAQDLAERATKIAERENAEKFKALCCALAFRNQRDEARQTAIDGAHLCLQFKQERDALAVECDDQARRMSSAALCLLEGAPAVEIPYRGAIVFGDCQDEQMCACGQTNSDEPCSTQCAEIAAKDAPSARAPFAQPSEPADDSKPKHFDSNKLRLELIPIEGLRATAAAMSYGAKKYGDHNWEKSPGLKALQYFGSIYRHLLDARSGIDADPESGVLHLGHASANIMMLIATLQRFPQSDNRKAQ